MLYRKIIILITVGAFSFASNFLRIHDFKGLDLKTAPDKIQNNRGRDITNLDFDVMGSLQTRKGISLIDSFDDNIKNINDRAENNYIFDNSIEYKGITADYSVNHYTNIHDDIYFFGDDMVKWSDYSNAFTGLGYDSPEYLDVEVFDVTGNLNGTYNYAVTYVYEDNFESQPYYVEDTTTGNVVFNNSYVALDLGSNKKFYIKLEGGSYVGYYIESDVVKVKRTLSIQGNIVWNYYEDDYFYMVTRLTDASTYKYYKIQVSNSLIVRQQEDNFSGDNTATSIGVNGLGFFVDSDGFYVAKGYVSISYEQLGYPPRYSEYAIVYKYSGNWNTRETIQTKLLISEYNNRYLNRTLGMYRQDGVNYVMFLSTVYGDNRLVMYRLSDGSYKQGEYNTNTVPYPPYTSIAFRSFYPIISLDEDYYFAGVKAMNWDNPTGNLSLNSYTQSQSGFTSYFHKQYFNVTSQDIQGVENDVWYQYEYDLAVPTISVVSSNTWDVETTGTQVTAINQKVRLYLPTEDVVATGINIYRQVDSTGYFFLDNAILGNTEYVDNISNTDQSVIPMETDNDKPPLSIDSEYIVARQFYLAPDGVIWYSKINNHESVPAENFIRIRSEADDRPVRLIEHFGGLLVFFEKSIWYIDLQSASTVLWVPRKLNTDFGCPFPFSVVKGKLPNQQIGVFYMAEDRSVRVLTGIGSDGIQLFDNIYTDKLSLPIDTITRADTTNEKDVYFTFYDYKLYVSIDDYLMVWDSQVGGEWTKYELPINVKLVDNIDNELVFGASNEIYKFANITNVNILRNGDFREGLVSWDVGSLIRANNKITEEGFYYKGSYLLRDFSVPTDNVYYLEIDYNVTGDKLYIFSGQDEEYVPVEGGGYTIVTDVFDTETGEGTYIAYVTGDIALVFGEKPKIDAEDYPTREIKFGWNYMGIISGDSMLVSEIIDWLEETIGSGNINNVLYYIDGVETYYNTSGDYTLNNGDGYWIQSAARDSFIFEWTMPERVTINFRTGYNYIFGYPYKQYKASEFLDRLEYASEVAVYDGTGWVNDNFTIGNALKTYGLRVDAMQDFTMVFEPASGIIKSVSIIGTQNYDIYYDLLTDQNLVKDSNMTGFEFWEKRNRETSTVVTEGIRLYTAWSPFNYLDRIVQTIDAKAEAYLHVEYTLVSGVLDINGNWTNDVDSEVFETYLTPNDNEEIVLDIHVRQSGGGPSAEPGEAIIHRVSLKYVEGIIPIDWNYKTKVFGDSFEYYQDFDKIWLRGIQTEESDIRVDYTCNNDLGYYSDYILMTLYGDSLVNTGVNSLLGAGGRDIQVETSGEGYIRLDGLSIKRTLREE